MFHHFTAKLFIYVDKIDQTYNWQLHSSILSFIRIIKAHYQIMESNQTKRRCIIQKLTISLSRIMKKNSAQIVYCPTRRLQTSIESNFKRHCFRSLGDASWIVKACIRQIRSRRRVLEQQTWQKCCYSKG